MSSLDYMIRVLRRYRLRHHVNGDCFLRPSRGLPSPGCVEFRKGCPWLNLLSQL